MNTNFIRQITHFTKSQRLGILCLVGIICTLQWIYLQNVFVQGPQPLPKDVEQWLAATTDVDTLIEQPKKYTVYPFNPNFLTSYKAYRWGMSTGEFERLVAFRELNKYVNTPQEFQEVTRVSDSLLQKMAPYFKFPEWVKYAKKHTNNRYGIKNTPIEKIVQIDINQATRDDFIAIRGVGEVLADRIIHYRNSLGAFVVMEQVNEVYGIQPEVIAELQAHFAIVQTPKFVKIKINEATIKELGQFPYFRYPVSRNIVAYRSMNGDLSFEELTNVKGINLEKLKIIALYLEF